MWHVTIAIKSCTDNEHKREDKRFCVNYPFDTERLPTICTWDKEGMRVFSVERALACSISNLCMLLDLFAQSSVLDISAQCGITHRGCTMLHKSMVAAAANTSCGAETANCVQNTTIGSADDDSVAALVAAMGDVSLLPTSVIDTSSFPALYVNKDCKKARSLDYADAGSSSGKLRRCPRMPVRKSDKKP